MKKLLFILIGLVCFLYGCTVQQISIKNMEKIEGEYYEDLPQDTIYIDLNNYVSCNTKYEVEYNGKTYSSDYELIFNLEDGENDFKIIGNKTTEVLHFFKNHYVKLDFIDEFGNPLMQMDTITNVVLDFNHVKQNMNVPAGYDWDGTVKISLGGSNLYVDGLFQNINITADMSIIPIFEPLEYELNIEQSINNGSNQSFVTKVKTGDELTFEIEGVPGYEFIGVYAKDDLIEEGTTYHPDMGTEFIIKYQPNVYEITYKYLNEEKRVPVLYDGEIKEFIPEIKGYTFNGWLFNGDSFSDKIYTYTESIELVADLTPNKYQIIFANANVPSINVSYGDEITLPTPTKDGYTFNGWYLNDKLFTENVWSFDSDVTLVAKWIANEIDLELETFGAELNDKAKVDENGLITLPVPILNGYDFKGWFYDPYFQNGVSNLKQSDYNNETLYAKFELNDELYLTSFVLEKYEEHSSNYDVLTMFNSDSSGFASKYWHKIGVTKNGDDYYVSGIATNGTSLSELGSYDYIILGYSSYPLYNSWENSNIPVGSKVIFSCDVDTLEQGDVNVIVSFVERDITESIDDLTAYLESQYDKYTTIDSNLSLITNYEGIAITWKSSNNEIISMAGIYRAPVNDVKVTLSAYVNNSLIYEFTVTAKGDGNHRKALATGYIYTPYKTITQNAMNVLDIIYCAFLDIDETASFTNETTMTNNINNYIKPLANNSGTKIVISVNQKSSGAFSAVAANEVLREKLATNILTFVEKVGIDGIDIDWETPSSTEAGNFTLLMEAIYRKMKAANPNYLVTAAIGGGKWQPPKYDLVNSKQYLDYINLMTYSMATGNSYYQNALYKSSKGATLTSCSIDESVKLYNSYGIENAKILVGIPFYLTVQTGSGGPGSKVGTGKSIWYNQLDTTYAVSDTMKEYFDEECGVPYRYDAVNQIFVSFDNEKSIKRKCEYINALGLAGIMYWQYGQDVDDQLSNAIGKYINAV
ncbi:MAG: InlB B-repeat-containing protein [Bacilli bacterium]|nr:InlB B-repeat-containing protein [Bacilli bacterium]